MTKALLLAASLGLVTSSAGACEYMRSAEAQLDTTVVASVAQDKTVPMSAPIKLDQPKAADVEATATE